MDQEIKFLEDGQRLFSKVVSFPAMYMGLVLADSATLSIKLHVVVVLADVAIGVVNAEQLLVWNPSSYHSKYLQVPCKRNICALRIRTFTSSETKKICPFIQERPRFKNEAFQLTFSCKEISR